jgi:hypothetical protein
MDAAGLRARCGFRASVTYILSVLCNFSSHRKQRLHGTISILSSVSEGTVTPHLRHTAQRVVLICQANWESCWFLLLGIRGPLDPCHVRLTVLLTFHAAHRSHQHFPNFQISLQFQSGHPLSFCTFHRSRFCPAARYIPCPVTAGLPRYTLSSAPNVEPNLLGPSLT